MVCLCDVVELGRAGRLHLSIIRPLAPTHLSPPTPLVQAQLSAVAKLFFKRPPSYPSLTHPPTHPQPNHPVAKLFFRHPRTCHP